VTFNRYSRAVLQAAGAAILIALALSNCATPPSDPIARDAFEQTNDPLEPLNRKTFAFNQLLDHIVFRPAAKAYVLIFPDDARKAIHHMLDNMKEPTLFFNNVLQGEFKRAEITLGRFVVDTTIGFGGMVDVMTLSGVERQPADFGQTMFVWGVPAGPYLILPILGPTNPRDAVGSTVDSYADPFTIMANDHGITELTTSRLIVGGVEERARVLDVLDDLEKNSVDFYAEMRSLSQQHRAAELRRGKAPDAVPGLYNDPDQATPPPAGPSPAKPGAGPVSVRQTAALPAPRPPLKLASARLLPTKPELGANPLEQIAAVPPQARSDSTRPTTYGLDFDEGSPR
jgi:phospholipid-binding lipoprotein MlaA